MTALHGCENGHVWAGHPGDETYVGVCQTCGGDVYDPLAALFAELEYQMLVRSGHAKRAKCREYARRRAAGGVAV